MPPIIFLTTLGSNSLTAIPIIELLCLQSVFPSVLTINSLVLVSWAMNDKEEEYLSNQDNESVNRQNTSTFPPTFDLHKLFRCSLAKYCLTLLFSLSTLVIYVLLIKSREVPWNLPTVMCQCLYIYRTYPRSTLKTPHVGAFSHSPSPLCSAPWVSHYLISKP